MRFKASTRTRVLVNMEMDFDPTGSTIEVKVDADWHAATWQGSSVQRQVRNEQTGSMETHWFQTARTTDYFAGPDVASPGVATVLSATTGSPPGRHPTQTRVTSGQDSIVSDSTPIDVR